MFNFGLWFLYPTFKRTLFAGSDFPLVPAASATDALESCDRVWDRPPNEWESKVPGVLGKNIQLLFIPFLIIKLHA